MRALQNSGTLAKLTQAFNAGREMTVTVNGRIISFTTEWTYGNAMTLRANEFFANEGFLLMKPAFASADELVRTCLQELYRLRFENISQGLTGPMANSLTNAASSFANKAFELFTVVN